MHNILGAIQIRIRINPGSCLVEVRRLGGVLYSLTTVLVLKALELYTDMLVSYIRVV